MAWTTPMTAVASNLHTAAEFNTYVRDNLNYLFARPYDQHMENASDYTTTSSSFTNVDGTDFAHTVTLAGTVALVWFSGAVSFGAVSQGIAFDVTVNGTSVSSGEGVSGVRAPSDGITDLHMNPGFAIAVPNLTPGVNIFRLQWRTSTNTATLKAGSGGILGVLATFGVLEVSDG